MFVRPAFFLLVTYTLGAEVPADVRTFLRTSCTPCHQGDKAPSGLDLTTLASDLNDAGTAQKWIRIHDQVQSGAMPPGSGRKGSPEKRLFLTSLARSITAQEQQVVTRQGRSVLRRLNRYEYENTLRDLLGAPWLQLRDSLPEDGLVARFNKSGRALDVSHVQMARYMETAEQALRQVIAAGRQKPGESRHYARDQKRFISRMKYTPFNRHPERASIPILGFDAQPEIIAEKAPISVGDKDPKTRELEGYATPAGNYVGNEHHFDSFIAPAGGRYKLRFNAFSLWIHTVYDALLRGDKKVWHRPDRSRTSKGRTTEPITIYALSTGGEKRRLGSFDVTPEPQMHELEVELLAGEKILPDAARLFRSRPGFIGSPHATAEGMPGVAYRWMEVAGPFNQELLLRMEGSTAADAERLLRSFMGRAYRRPPQPKEIERYLSIVKQRLGSSTFEDALLAGYTAVLCSPGFLYLEEQPGQLDSWALASRLSYFLWNAPPDATLRKLARSGTLKRPAVLRAQVDRLLDSPRSRDFTDAFLDYWLDLRKLNDTTPDVTLYPDYYLDDLLTESAQFETQMFFHRMLQKDLPARNIISSDWTFANSHLARHYELPAVEGVAMRPVQLPKGSPRGGILTQASVLKITANGTTTSPVLRGVWVMERILGDPPPPPPPGVPAVEPDTRGAVTIRQQLEKHRSVKSCAGCHAKIDPPGFALESFDVLGGWRDRYRSTHEGEPVKGIGKNGIEFAFRHGVKVDSSGQMADGGTFADVSGFRKLLLQNERQVARNLAAQFIAYATGSPVSFSDRPELDRIVDSGSAGGYRVRTLIQEIVNSRLFRSK